MRNLIIFVFFFLGGLSASSMAQSLGISKAEVWSGTDVEHTRMEWSIYSEEKLNKQSFFVPAPVGTATIALRDAGGKYAPHKLYKSVGGDDYSVLYAMRKPLAKKFNSGTMVWDSLGGRGYFTREKKGHHSIWRTDRITGKEKPLILPFEYNNKAFSVAWPALSPNGLKLVFASDMPGGLGGWDLYVCERSGTGWGPPQSLGEAVNSPSDEKYPSFSEDGTLYFSSDREGSGLGGFDLYQSRAGSPATALPYPFNSAFDDLAVSFPDSNYIKANKFRRGTAYLASNRPLGESKTAGDIKVFRLTQNELVRFAAEHKRRMEPLAEIKAEVVDGQGNSAFIYSDENGHFSFFRERGIETSVTCTYPGMDTVRITRNYSWDDLKVVQIDDYAYWEVEVYVTHKRARSPLEGARVVVLANEVPTDTFFTDDKGRAVFELNPIPGYKLRVERAGFTSQVFTLRKPTKRKYSQSVLPQMPELMLTLVRGKVLNSENQPVQGAELEAYEGLVKVPFENKVMTDTEGRYEFFLERKKTFSVVGKWGSGQVGTFNVTTDQYRNRRHIDTLHMDLELVNLKQGEVAAKFYYDGDPILLQAGSYPEMKSFLRYLQAFPKLKIQLEVHTDTRQGANASWRLGKNAGDFAADYFFINDIARDRVKVKSFGRSQPATNCNNCSQADHQANRRVEIRVLEH